MARPSLTSSSQPLQPLQPSHDYGMAESLTEEMETIPVTCHRTWCTGCPILLLRAALTSETHSFEGIHVMA